MPRVRARLVKGVENTASRPSHFRVVGAHLDLDLFDGFDAGNDDRPVSQVGDGDSVDGVVVGASRPAADGEVGGGVLILHSIELGNATRNHVRSGDRHVEGVPGRRGKCFQLDPLERGPARRVGCFQDRGFGVDHDGLGDPSDLELNVEHEEALDSDFHSRPLVGGEALDLHRDRVSSRLQAGKGVLADVIRDRRTGRPGGLAPNSDRGAGNDAAGVPHHTPNSAVVGLSQKGARQRKEDEQSSHGLPPA